MKSSKSINSLVANGNQMNMMQASEINHVDSRSIGRAPSESGKSAASPTSPICRCRVMYLGSSVPHITKDGLQGIQEPLRELYPDKATLASGNAGIDSWLSVWSNGILIENVDETGKEVKRFFKIDALHYCAAVKYVSLPNQPLNSYSTLPSNANLTSLPKFLPLDSPHARQMNSNPPIFASILRRTTGIKVLECHAFICKREAAANALVRCCFHAYADTMYAKQIGADVSSIANDMNNNQIVQTVEDRGQAKHQDPNAPMISRRSKSIAALNDANSKKLDSWKTTEANTHNQHSDMNDERTMMQRRKSMNESRNQNCDNGDSYNELSQMNNENLRRQQKLSKSMHHLNQGDQSAQMIYNQMNRGYMGNFAPNSTSCANIAGVSCTYQDLQQVPQQPFYDPNVARVPNYPPQNLIDATSTGGTLRSIKSMAANSIASTLLRSKKHAKAMSTAQLNHDRITSFHQPHSNVNTIGGLMTMPPVPPMFLPNLQARLPINGSQTMKVTSRPMMPLVGPPINFEAMTPKEMKKLLKKSAKYGIDPSKFSENGLPILPLRPPPLPPTCHVPAPVDSSLMFHDIYGNDTIDMSTVHGMTTPRMPIPEILDHSQMKPILVKPNSEFLKSRAGKKWLKQQKEFKKLLPPHLDGLPIIFGPPPLDALEPAIPPNQDIQPPAFIPPPIPMMDSSGYYNPHPFYGHNGRASTASTLLRYSPQSQVIHDNSNLVNQTYNGPNDYYNRSNMVYNGVSSSSSLGPGSRDHLVDTSILAYNDSRSFMDNSSRGSRRSHMVEQSVISLGDENDYEDDEPDQQDPYAGANQQDHSLKNSRDQNGSTYANYQHENGHSNYDQVMPNSEDQNIYSSGINRRGHMNERAFSYSIRQEHKSSSGNNSDAADYATRGGTVSNNHNEQDNNYSLNISHQGNSYHSGRNHHEDQYRQNTGQQFLPVNELTARLENQLNMKSFVTPRIK